MQQNQYRALHRFISAKAFSYVKYALAVLAIFVTVSVRGDAEMCYALFYPRPEVRGLQPHTYSQLNKALSNKSFLDRMAASLAKEGLQVSQSRTVIEMLTEAASYLETDSTLEFKSARYKAQVWSRATAKILEMAQAEFLKNESPHWRVELLFPLKLVLDSLGYRFESIAFNDQHLTTTESRPALEVLSSYPNIKRKYLQTDVMAADSTKAKSLLEIPSLEEHGHTKARPKTLKVATMNTKLRDTLLEVYNLMHDVSEFENYTRKLFLDTAVMMQRNHNEKAEGSRIDPEPTLNKGLLSPEAGLKTLLFRFIRWGIPIHPIFNGFITARDFQKILQSGSTVLDFGILEKVPQHGFASHVIQLDYVLTRLSERYGHDLAVVKVKMLLDFFATADGVGFWSDLFDSLVLGQLNSPITLNHEVTRWLSGFTRDISQFN